MWATQWLLVRDIGMITVNVPGAFFAAVLQLAAGDDGKRSIEGVRLRLLQQPG